MSVLGPTAMETIWQSPWGCRQPLPPQLWLCNHPALLQSGPGGLQPIRQHQWMGSSGSRAQLITGSRLCLPWQRFAIFPSLLDHISSQTAPLIPYLYTSPPSLGPDSTTPSTVQQLLQAEAEKNTSPGCLQPTRTNQRFPDWSLGRGKPISITSTSRALLLHLQRPGETARKHRQWLQLHLTVPWATRSQAVLGRPQCIHWCRQT